MKRILKKILLVFIVLGMLLIGAVFFLRSMTGKYSSLFSEVVRKYNIEQEAGIQEFKKHLENPGFKAWFTTYLKSEEEVTNRSEHFADCFFEFTSDDISIPKQIQSSAFRRRYRTARSLFVAQNPERMPEKINQLDFSAFTREEDRSILFWYSFFSSRACKRYYELFGYDEFQKLLQTILFYPFIREKGGVFHSPGSSLAEASISKKSIEELISGEFELPMGLLEDLDRSFSIPIMLEKRLGSDKALQWYKQEMARKPERKLNLLAKAVRIKSESAEQLFIEYLDAGEIPVTSAHLFLEPCYKAGIALPEEFIREGLKSDNEKVKLYATMQSLLQFGTDRLRLVHEMIISPNNYEKYMLVFRLLPDDFDSPMIQHLKRLFTVNLDSDDPVSKVEALIVVMKFYEFYGEPGLIDLLPAELFKEKGESIATILQLLGAPAGTNTFEGLLNWIPSIKGVPVWWLVAFSDLPEDLKREQVYGAALGVFQKKYTEQINTPQPYWKVLFALDYLDKRERYEKDAMLPLKMFGLISMDKPEQYIQEMFWSGTKESIDYYLSEPARRTGYFGQFR